MIIRYLYILFLGILLSLFVGVGIAAFYASPSSPNPPLSYPNAPYPTDQKSSNSAQMIQDQKRFDAAMQRYQDEYKMYSRNVSIISLAFAIAFLAVSFVFLARVVILSDGFLLGGLFTLIYSIIKGFGSDDSKYRFLVVSISLVIALALGYMKFIKSTSAKK